MKTDTLYIFIDDSISRDNKKFMTMYIVTEYEDFDNDINTLKKKIKSLAINKKHVKFLYKPKNSTSGFLSNNQKKYLKAFLTNILTNKIIEHDFLLNNIKEKDFKDFYYKEDIKKIINIINIKYKEKYKNFIFDHSSNNKINKLIIFENPTVKIKQGDDSIDSGLIIVDLLRQFINM